MKSATITFDQTFADSEGNIGNQVNHTEVPVTADGESVVFELPDGQRWSCDQAALADLVFSAELEAS